MRILIYIVLFTLSLTNVVCQTFEFIPNGKDTINYSLSNGERKGMWILYGRNKPKTCYTLNQIVETGYYGHNMKQGVWKEYHCTGMLKSEQVYVNGKVSGLVTIYYEDGKIKTRGTFKNNKWVGPFELFDQKGNLTYLIRFDAEGKRQQSFYYKVRPGGKKDSVMVFAESAVRNN